MGIDSTIKAILNGTGAEYSTEQLRDALKTIDSGDLFDQVQDWITNGVTATDIADLAVTTGKIALLAVGTAQLAADAVDKTKIAADVAGAGLGQNVDGSLEVNVTGAVSIAGDDVTIAAAAVTDSNLATSYIKADGTRAYSAAPKLTIEGFDGVVNTGYALIENCDANFVTTEDGNTIFDSDLDAVTFKEGTGSVKISSLTSDPIGVTPYRCYDNAVGSVDWETTSNRIGFWVRSDTALSLGDLQVYINDTVAGDQYIDVPAVATIDTWQYVELDLSTVTATSVDEFGFSRGVAGTFVAHVDSIVRYNTSGDVILSQTPVDDGIIILSEVKANTGVHTKSTLVKGTDYWVDVDNKRVIFITDQSANTMLCFYAHV